MRYRLAHLLILMAVISFVACFIVKPYLFPRPHGEWVGSRDDCPKRILDLIDQLEKLPPRCDYDTLLSTLRESGFDIKPQHYKDTSVDLGIDGRVRGTDRFVLSITLSWILSGEVLDATVREVPERGGILDLWRIDYRNQGEAG